MELVPLTMTPDNAALGSAPPRRPRGPAPDPDGRRAERARRHARERLRGDLRGGLVAGLLTAVSTVSYASVIGVPLGAGMAATAVLAGLVGAVVGGSAAAWIGSVPVQVFAPRASVAVVVASAATAFAAQHAGQPDALARTLAMLSLCLLLAALAQMAMGLMRLGGLIRLIPHPVATGLTVAIALKLAWSQWPLWLGAAVRNDPGWLAPFAAGTATLLAIGLAQWRGYATYAMLIGLAAGIACSLLLGPQPHLPPVQVAEGTLALSPLAQLPGWLDRITELLSPDLLAFAFVIALLNSMETLTATLTLEDALARRFDANRTLVAGAIGSLLAVVAGGLPVAAGAATSMANVRSGGRTHMSALLTALVVVVLAVGLGHWIALIPSAVVAGIMMMVAVGLVTAPLLELAQQWPRRHDDPRRVHGDLAVALLVGGLMLAAGMMVALLVGLQVATWLALLHMRAGLVVRRYYANDAELSVRLRELVGPAVGRTIHIVEIGQPLFFATIEAALRVIEQPAGSMRFLVVDLTRIGGPDLTAARSLARSCAALHAKGRQLLVVRSVRAPAVEHALRDCLVFDDLETALRHCTVLARHTAAGRAREQGSPSSLFDSRSTSTSAMPQADVDSELGWFVGPLPPSFVRRAASRSKDVRDMLRLLAGELPAPEAHATDARDSLQFRLEHLGSNVSITTVPRQSTFWPDSASSVPPHMQDALDRVGRELAADLAPVLGVLATRVPASAGTGTPVAQGAAASHR